MATAKKIWKGEVTLAATNGYGAAVADLAADGAYDYTSGIDLETDGYEGAVISLEADSSGTTDNIIISCYGSTDGGATFDNEPIYSIELDATSGADLQLSFIIRDYPHVRFGVKTTGTTDTFDYRIIWDAWRWDVS